MKKNFILMLAFLGIVLINVIHPQPNFYKRYGSYLKAAGAATAAYILYKYYYSTPEAEEVVTIVQPIPTQLLPEQQILNIDKMTLEELRKLNLRDLPIEQQRKVAKRKSILIEREKIKREKKLEQDLEKKRKKRKKRKKQKEEEEEEERNRKKEQALTQAEIIATMSEEEEFAYILEQSAREEEEKRKEREKKKKEKLAFLSATPKATITKPVKDWLKNNCSGISFNYLQSAQQQSNECGSFALFNAHALQQVYNANQPITSKNIKDKFTPIFARARKAYQEFGLPVCLPENIQAYEILGVQKFINEFAKTKNWHLLPPFTNLFFFNVTGTNIQIVYPSEEETSLEKTTLEKQVQLTKTEMQRFNTAIKKENGIIHCLVRYSSGGGGHFVLFSIIKTKGQRPNIIFLNSKNPPLVKESGAFKFIEYICKQFNAKE